MIRARFLIIIILFVICMNGYANSIFTPAQRLGLDNKILKLKRYEQMERELGQAKLSLKQQASDDAYQSKVQEQTALSPERVLYLRKLALQNMAATHMPLFHPKQLISTKKLFVHSAIIQNIHITPNFFSTVAFYDNTGAPWPITKGGVDIASNQFQYKILGAHQNELLIWVKGNDIYTQANGIVSLKGVNAPIILNFVANDALSDSRLTFIVPEVGPIANTLDNHSEINVNPQEDDTLLQFLTGIAPPSAEPLRVVGMDGQAWKYHGKTYIRTDSFLRSPAWIASRTAGSVHVYQLGNISELLFTKNGRSEMVSLEAGDKNDS